MVLAVRISQHLVKLPLPRSHGQHSASLLGAPAAVDYGCFSLHAQHGSGTLCFRKSVFIINTYPSIIVLGVCA